MSAGKKNIKFDHYVLSHKLKNNGFELWRTVFNGTSKTTGEERTFFIEFYLVNPGISPKSVVIAQKSRLKLSGAELQYALAGTESALDADREQEVIPSYVLVKAGSFGQGGKQFNQFFPSGSFTWTKSDRSLHAGGCILSDDTMTGSLTVSSQQLHEAPELLCNAGTMDWNLRYEKQFSPEPGYRDKNAVWYAAGIKSVFAGIVHFDGAEYTVIPKISYGYFDKTWGPSCTIPGYHLSSTHLSSIITGKPLARSCFAVHGEYDGHVRLLLILEGKPLNILFHTPFDHYSETHDCIEMPHNDDGEKLHWTASFRKNKLVVDIDVFCHTSDMMVRDYEVPEGQRKLLKVLGGGNGYGELRVYQKTGDDLELIEHAHIATAVCEYSTIALPEK